MNIEKNKIDFFEKYEIIKRQPMQMSKKLFKIVNDENNYIDADHCSFYKDTKNNIIMTISPYLLEKSNIDEYVKRGYYEIPSIYNDGTRSFIKYFIKNINI
jgi:hypothetical protein